MTIKAVDDVEAICSNIERIQRERDNFQKWGICLLRATPPGKVSDCYCYKGKPDGSNLPCPSPEMDNGVVLTEKKVGEEPGHYPGY